MDVFIEVPDTIYGVSSLQADWTLIYTFRLEYVECQCSTIELIFYFLNNVKPRSLKRQ